MHSWYGLTCTETLSLSTFSPALLVNPWVVGGLHGELSASLRGAMLLGTKPRSSHCNFPICAGASGPRSRLSCLRVCWLLHSLEQPEVRGHVQAPAYSLSLQKGFGALHPSDLPIVQSRELLLPLTDPSNLTRQVRAAPIQALLLVDILQGGDSSYRPSNTCMYTHACA